MTVFWFIIFDYEDNSVSFLKQEKTNCKNSNFATSKSWHIELKQIQESWYSKVANRKKKIFNNMHQILHQDPKATIWTNCKNKNGA